MFRLFNRNLDDLEETEIRLLIDRSGKIQILSQRLFLIFEKIKKGELPHNQETTNDIRGILKDIRRYLGDEKSEVKKVKRLERKKR